MPDSTVAASTLVDYLKNASIGGLLGAILFASYSGYWVWGSEYAKLERDRDEWKALAMKAAHLIDDPTVRPVGMAPPVVNDFKRSVESKLETSR